MRRSMYVFHLFSPRIQAKSYVQIEFKVFLHYANMFHSTYHGQIFIRPVRAVMSESM